MLRPGPGTKPWDLHTVPKFSNMFQIPPDPTHCDLFILTQENRWKQQTEMSVSVVLVPHPVTLMLEGRRLREISVLPSLPLAQGLDTN